MNAPPLPFGSRYRTIHISFRSTHATLGSGDRVALYRHCSIHVISGDGNRTGENEWAPHPVRAPGGSSC